MKAKLMMVVLAGAACAAACAPTEGADLVAGDACDGVCGEGLECRFSDGKPEEARCVPKGAPSTPSTPSATYTCATSINGTCPAGQACQLSGSAYTCIVPSGSSTTVNNPGASQVVVNPVPTPSPPLTSQCAGSTSGTCPAGQVCQWSGSAYACVSTSSPPGQAPVNPGTTPPASTAAIACSRPNSDEVVVNFSSMVRDDWRRFRNGDESPPAMPAYLLPVGGTGVTYSWNDSAISVESARAKCVVSNGAASCRIRATSGTLFTFHGCDRDPEVGNQGCIERPWMKVDRFQPRTTAPCHWVGTNLVAD